MLDALHFEFMRHALMAGLLASVICGIMGTLVVANRIVFLSGGIAHAAYIGQSGYEFSSVLSNALIFGGAALGAMYLFLEQRSPGTDRGPD